MDQPPQTPPEPLDGSSEPIVAVSRESLYYEASEEELPTFKELLSITPDSSDGDLSEPNQELIRRYTRRIEKLCDEAGYEIVAAEFNLLSDHRLLSPDETPLFSTFLLTYATPPEAGAVYRDAMTYITKTYKSRDWIVWHRDLYDGTHPLLVGRFDRLTRRDDGSPGAAERSTVNKEPHIRLVSLELRFDDWKYIKQGGSPEFGVKKRIDGFLNAILDRAAESGPGLYSLWRQSTALIVPIARPGDLKKDKDFVFNMAGLLFLFVRPRADNTKPGTLWNPIRLGRDILFVITDSLLRESHSSLDLEISKKRLLSSMAHGTVTAIRSIRTSDLSNALCYNSPPRNVKDLKVSRNESTSGTEDEASWSLNLVKAIRNALLCENSAAALVSFIEMSSDSGCIRHKFQNRTKQTLLELLEEAALMADNPSPSADYCSPSVTSLGLEYGDSKDRLHRCIIPLHYLNAKLIKGIVCELMHNALEHGHQNDVAHPQVTLRIECFIDTTDFVVLRLINRISETRENRRSGFLKRTKAVLVSLNQPIHLEYGDDGTLFIAELHLGPVSVESSQGPRTVKLNYLR